MASQSAPAKPLLARSDQEASQQVQAAEAIKESHDRRALSQSGCRCNLKTLGWRLDGKLRMDGALISQNFGMKDKWKIVDGWGFMFQNFGMKDKWKIMDGWGFMFQNFVSNQVLKIKAAINPVLHISYLKNMFV